MRNQRNEVALLERPQTTAPRPPERPLRWRPLSRAHKGLFVGTTAFYLVVIVAVLTTSRLVAFDWSVMMFRPYEHWPAIQSFLNVYVIAGQRGPSAIAVAIWLGWRCWRTRSMRPLLVLGVALVLLNMSVGAVKISMGRLGPHYAHVAGSNEIFLGGGIFPSGHTANAVVTWGVLAYLASRWRRSGAVVAGFMGLSVGLTTVYLGTHWVTDVLAGWAAGVLVMLALPLFEPVVASADERIQRAWADRRALWAKLLRRPAPSEPALAPALAEREPAAEPTAAAVPVKRVVSQRAAGEHSGARG
ncbi:phosphatase PAP2 family protein [Streptacidiphilus sp. PAMC 29251]